MTWRIRLLPLMLLVAGACAAGTAGESSTSTEAGVYTTIQGEQLALVDVSGPAVVFAWSPG